MVGYDGTLSMEHEDSLMSPNEGLCKGVEFLQSIVLRDAKGRGDLGVKRGRSNRRQTSGRVTNCPATAADRVPCRRPFPMTISDQFRLGRSHRIVAVDSRPYQIDAGQRRM